MKDTEILWFQIRLYYILDKDDSMCISLFGLSAGWRHAWLVAIANIRTLILWFFTLTYKDTSNVFRFSFLFSILTTVW